MKTKTIKFSMIFAMASGLFLASCGNDDGGTTPPPPAAATCSDGVQNGDETGVDCGGSCANSCEAAEDTALTGSMTEDRELDPSKEYTITGVFSVESGATLTIPAGTKIVSETGTDRYIVVQKGAMIDIQGTAAAPVIMTSANETPGDWGGLVIAGNAETTEGVDATAEVGGILYGGSANDDNSGSISYLVINYAGAQINSESQYNGLTLYSVGSGTTIDNVAILNGTDDGVEFFGGTVSATNLYLENNEDDAVDWTEGWSGSITDTYVLHTNAGFSTAIEADGVNANPTITNFTAVSTKGGTALQFKKESGATITGLSLTGYQTSVDMPNDGPLANIQIDGADADPAMTYLADPSVDISAFAWVSTETSVETMDLVGTVDADMELDSDIIYRLTGSLSVETGATLTIPAGTVIIADAAEGESTSTYIVVKKGAMIDVQGTAEAPVIMTSSDQNPGDWGGLLLLGNGVTSEGVDATAEVGGFQYGGTDNTDNSGSISYLVINYAGAQINSESQYNGLTLYAVGSGTTIENVAILNGTDDGVEFFGGAVNASNFYLENNEDDAVDWTEGWNGTLTNTYVLHSVAGFSTAVEADGVDGADQANNPTLENFTAISSVDGTALQFKKTTGATITNLYLEGYATLVDMPNDGPLANILIDGAAATTEGPYTSGTQVDVATFAWATGE
tara:strand:- start:5488 stop:7533 length:2046 start_codon:yes stop_codon:yes gene_type:complete